MIRKAKNSKKAGDLLVSNKMFNQSIHCYYYSCLQHSKYILNQIGISYEEQSQNGNREGSHVYIINKVRNNISKSNITDAQMYYESLMKLKTFRKIADYNKADFRKKRITYAQELHYSISEILKKHYT